MKITHEVNVRDLVTELMRGTYPVGESVHDRASNAKLREVAAVADELVFQIWNIHYLSQYSDLASEQEANEIAKKFLAGLREFLNETEGKSEDE